MISGALKLDDQPSDLCDELGAYMVLRRPWSMDWVQNEGSQALFYPEGIIVPRKCNEVLLDVKRLIPGE